MQTLRTRPAAPPTNAPATVLHVIPLLNTGGAETMLMRVQERIMQRGHYRPLICGMKAGGTLEPLLAERGIPYCVLGIPRRSIYAPHAFLSDVRRAIHAVRALVREERAALIQSHLSDADLIATLVGRLEHIPSVLTHQSSNLLPEGRRPGFRASLRKAVVRRMYRRADALISVSPAVTEALRTQAGVPDAKIAVVYNSVDVPGRPTPEQRARGRAAIGAAPDERVVFCTARLVENKGQRYLIEALACLPAACEPIHVCFLGDGPDRPVLETAARAVPAPHRVTFLGLRHDAVGLLPAADLFCLPSMWEGLSVSLIEALAQEIPVVATDAPGIRDTVTHDRHALLVPPRDPAALAGALLDLLQNPDRAATLASAGRALVESRYSLDTAATATEALYDRLLRRHAT